MEWTHDNWLDYSLYPDILEIPQVPASPSPYINEENTEQQKQPDGTSSKQKNDEKKFNSSNDAPSQSTHIPHEGQEPSSQQFGTSHHLEDSNSRGSNSAQIHLQLVANSYSLSTRKRQPGNQRTQSNANISGHPNQMANGKIRNNSLPNVGNNNTHPVSTGYTGFSQEHKSMNTGNGNKIQPPQKLQPQSQPVQQIDNKNSNFRIPTSFSGRFPHNSATQFHPYSLPNQRSSKLYARNSPVQKISYNPGGARPPPNSNSNVLRNSHPIIPPVQSPTSPNPQNAPSLPAQHYSRNPTQPPATQPQPPHQPQPAHFQNQSVGSTPAMSSMDHKQRSMSFGVHQNSETGQNQQTNIPRTPHYHQNQLSSFMPNSNSFQTIYSRSQNAFPNPNYTSCRYITMSAPVFASPYFNQTQDLHYGNFSQSQTQSQPPVPKRATWSPGNN